MNKLETIKSSKEIDLIFKNGKKFNLPFLTFLIYKDEEDKVKGKVAFIAGKKNGNAIWRNKSKRRLREIYKKLNILPEYKVLLIANKKTIEVNFDETIKISKEKLREYIKNE